MLYSIKNRKNLEKLEELVSLKNQVQEARLQDRLGEQNYHHNVKKLYEPPTKKHLWKYNKNYYGNFY